MARLSQLKMILRILLKSCEKDNIGKNNKSDDFNCASNADKKDT